ncbi:MAG: YraN family protein [Pirellulales bacterium]
MPGTWLAAFRAWLGRWRTPPSLGQRGEAAAAKFLRGLGYVIVARSARHRLGEIDIVAVEGRTVVFVEVKTRESHDAGHPAEAVTPDKQRRLTRLALNYLKRHGLLEHAARFDVVAITWPAGGRRPVIEHIKNAFEASGFGGMYS